MSETRLRILTLNCWGLKYVSQYRSERMAAIGHALTSSNYDLITLQEVWVYGDFDIIRKAVSDRLPHTKFFYSGALGAGLAIFSRFPIMGATINPYSLNGSPIEVLQGDWFVGKAAASVLVAHPVLGQLQIFNTHLFAPGGDSGPYHLQAHRLVNAWELAKLARQAAEVGRYVIAAGDFNSTPASLAMSLIRDHASLRDAWVESHPSTPSVPGIIPSAVDAVNLFGITADSPLNSFSSGKHLEVIARKFQGKRLDYIFFRQPSSPPASVKTPILKIRDTKVVFTERIPGKNISYSDHFGVEATFEISHPEDGDLTDPSDTHIPAPTEPPGPNFVLTTVPNPTPVPQQKLSANSITEVLHSLTACYRYSQYRARSQLTVFSVCIVVLLVIIVGSAWLPTSSFNPLIIFVTIFLAWAATTFLYIGFVYGRWEVNALTNVIEELEIYRDNLLERQS